jgi:hypothetical protein
LELLENDPCPGFDLVIMSDLIFNHSQVCLSPPIVLPISSLKEDIA